MHFCGAAVCKSLNKFCCSRMLPDEFWSFSFSMSGAFFKRYTFFNVRRFFPDDIRLFSDITRFFVQTSDLCNFRHHCVTALFQIQINVVLALKLTGKDLCELYKIKASVSDKNLPDNRECTGTDVNLNLMVGCIFHNIKHFSTSFLHNEVLGTLRSNRGAVFLPGMQQAAEPHAEK